MSRLVDLLRKIGLVAHREVDGGGDGGKTAVDVPKRIVTLEQLLAGTPDASMATMDVDLNVPPDAIFAAAGITPPASGWTVERVLEFVSRPTYAGMALPMQQQTVRGVLESEGVSVEDVLRDLVLRDRAIDRYEELLAPKLVAERQRLSLEVERLEVERRAIERKIAAQQQVIASLETRFEAWRDRKLDLETRWATAAGYLTDDPTVTVSVRKPATTS